jgi:hypothetical protein
MSVEIGSLTPVLPVYPLAAAVEVWTRLLGVKPTFVDGDRWAQFDVNGRRLALAGTDRVSDLAGVMIKVNDVKAARSAAQSQGLSVGEIDEGPHETRCTATAPGGWSIVFYCPREIALEGSKRALWR